MIHKHFLDRCRVALQQKVALILNHLEKGNLSVLAEISKTESCLAQLEHKMVQFYKVDPTTQPDALPLSLQQLRCLQSTFESSLTSKFNLTHLKSSISTHMLNRMTSNEQRTKELIGRVRFIKKNTGEVLVRGFENGLGQIVVGGLKAEKAKVIKAIGKLVVGSESVEEEGGKINVSFNDHHFFALSLLLVEAVVTREHIKIDQKESEILEFTN